MNKCQMLLGILLGVAAMGSSAQNLLMNGGFETVGGGGILTLNVGSTNLPGWSIGGTGTFFHVPNIFTSLQPKEGDCFISFNYNSATISQTFPTIPNESYDVSFCVGYFQGNTNMGVLATVLSDTGTPLAACAVTAPATRSWNASSRFRFTAASNLTKLQFIGTNATPNVDLLLDDVSVESAVRPVSIGVPDFQVCWESKSNRVYQLQYRSDFTTNLWTDLGAPTAGTGLPICSIQPTAEPQRFFRVITLP